MYLINMSLALHCMHEALMKLCNIEKHRIFSCYHSRNEIRWNNETYIQSFLIVRIKYLINLDTDVSIFSGYCSEENILKLSFSVFSNYVADAKMNSILIQVMSNNFIGIYAK